MYLEHFSNSSFLIAKTFGQCFGQRACQTNEEYPKRAAFCVPIIINAINAFDVSKRPTPEMEEAGKKPGTNLADKLLNEPNMPTRCCVVLRVSGDGVAWMQKDSNHGDPIIRILMIGQTRGKQLSGELKPTVPLQPPFIPYKLETKSVLWRQLLMHWWGFEGAECLCTIGEGAAPKSWCDRWLRC